MSHLASLENELCAELNITIICSGLRDVTKRSGVQSCVGIAKVRVIEDIEHLGAELEFRSLFNREVLEQREVRVNEAGPIEDVSSGIAKGERCGQRKRG